MAPTLKHARRKEKANQEFRPKRSNETPARRGAAFSGSTPAFQPAQVPLRLGRELEDINPHFLAGLEFDGGAGGNGHVGFRFVGIAADARLADFDFKNAEVAQFHLVAFGERLGDVVQRFLHHVEHLLLGEAGFPADAGDEVAFGQCHDVLYYDFNLTKNDTFIFRGHKMFVDSVSTVSLNDNEKRKSIYFSDSIKCGDQWVAGIGSIHGLTYVGFLGCEFPTPPPNLYLSCFFENDTLNYPNTTINYCDQEAIGVNEIQNKKDLIHIFPNPAIDNITIETHQKSTMEILNIQGQTIIQQPIQQGKTNIDISGLAKGVYILRLNNNDKTAVTKIVKE